MAQDYDEMRPDVAEASDATLKTVQTMGAPDARNVSAELDESENIDGVTLPDADLSDEELNVTVVPQGEDEFTCGSCFLVRHRSQVARESKGIKFCKDCEG
ncbi:DUF4193 domain-containing protein [Arthrobacter sp. KK5.5]|uniref:DUF4193 domain-containing protein n=1 Tax=Arthrobacter sp. KK5.5 TaxID=3373084 RepID=UPI003EE6E99F